MATQTKRHGIYGPSYADDASVGTESWDVDDPENNPFVDLDESGVPPPGRNVSHYLVCVGLEFEIPTGATIRGIAVTANCRGYYCKDNSIRVYKASTLVGSDAANADWWPSPVSDKSWGAGTDLWGTGWTAADINGSGFGVAISAARQDGPGTFSTVEVFYVDITVTYDLPISGMGATPVFPALLRSRQGTPDDSTGREAEGDARKVQYQKLPYYLAYQNHRKQGAALIGYCPKGDAVVGRTVRERLDEFPSVKDWGAEGDGSTDDTAAIQAAIDAVYSGWGGGTIVFPHGQYKVSSTITVRDYVRLQGGGAVGAGDYSRSCGFRVYTGRAAANTYAFNVKAGAGMAGFHFWYPEQVTNSQATPTVYGWTIGTSTTTADIRDAVDLHDLFFLNAYAAIRLYNCPRFIVEHIYGQPFSVGIYADYCLYPCTLRDVRFDTWYAASTDTLYAWIHTNGRAFDIRQAQGLFGYNLQANGYKEGFYLNHANLRVDLFGVDVQASTYPFHIQACDDVAVHGGLLTSGEAGIAGITCANPLTGYLGLFGLRCFDQGGDTALLTNTSGTAEIVGCA